MNDNKEFKSNDNVEELPIQSNSSEKLPQPKLKTFKIEKSNILERLNNFLPDINQDENCVNMEEVDSDDEEYIEMNLGLGVFDVNPSNADDEELRSDEIIELNQEDSIKDIKLSNEQEESTTVWDFIQDPRGEKVQPSQDILLPTDPSLNRDDSDVISNKDIHHPGIEILSEIKESNSTKSG